MADTYYNSEDIFNRSYDPDNKALRMFVIVTGSTNRQAGITSNDALSESYNPSDNTIRVVLSGDVKGTSGSSGVDGNFYGSSGTSGENGTAGSSGWSPYGISRPFVGVSKDWECLSGEINGWKFSNLTYNTPIENVDLVNISWYDKNNGDVGNWFNTAISGDYIKIEQQNNPNLFAIYLITAKSTTFSQYDFNATYIVGTTGQTFNSFTDCLVTIIYGGNNGTSGTSGKDGNFLGSSGTSGAGTPGLSGTSGTSGESGTSGSSGKDGNFLGSSGTSGESGTSGTSGENGTSGTSGENGTSGTSGADGINGGNILMWKVNTTNAYSIGDFTPTPNSGQITGINELWFNEIDFNGVNAHNWFEILNVWVTSNPGRARINAIRQGSGNLGGTWRVNSVVDNITGHTLSVTNITGNGTITNGVKVLWSYTLDGADGSSGTSGESGTSGTSGNSGTSGTSGASGTSGTSGENGTSGTSGQNGTSGISQQKGNWSAGYPYVISDVVVEGTTTYIAIANSQGFQPSVSPSEWTPMVGTSGTSGTSGESGTSGTSGTSGLTGTSGTSGTSGENGTSGTSGETGVSGTSGESGTSGTSGLTGTSGTSGESGTSGTSGESGTSGTSGESGTSGTSGETGASGTSGTSGENGTSGLSGSSGSSGESPEPLIESDFYYDLDTKTLHIVNLNVSGVTLTGETAGVVKTDSSGIIYVDTTMFLGSSGTSGNSGTSGSSGKDGYVGNDGSSGTSGTSGNSGTSGTSGNSGTSGTSGTSGNTGTSGTSGKSGTSGTSGINGTSGTAGTAGTSGITPTNTSVSTVTGTTYVFVSGDAGTLVLFSSGSAVAATIPASGTTNFTIGTRIDCIQSGAGKVTFAGGATTILSQSSNKAIAAQYVGVTLVKTAADSWYIVGNLIA